VQQKFLGPHLRMLIFSGFLFLIISIMLVHVLINVYAAHAAIVPNTIFVDTAPATFNITTRGSNGNISYNVTDLSHTLVTQGNQTVTGQHVTLTLPIRADGYYTLNISDHTALFAPHQHISFTVVAPPTGTDSPFGVGIHLGLGDGSGITPLITRLGTTMIRTDITWSQVEQTPGHYTFNTYDPELQVLQQNNLSPLLVLDYTNRFYDNGQTPYDNTGLTAFANYAKAVVTHYGSQLQAVEIYNEYNGFFSTGPCARNPACYVHMLQYTYQALKSVRPDITVVGGAVFSADLLWFRQLFQDGGLRFMDVVSDHPYPLISSLSPEREGLTLQMNMLQSLIKRYNNGVAKPIWITELGWPTSLLNVDEQTQAQYLVRGAVLSLASGVQKFFWYDYLNDGTAFYNSEQNFGLVRQPDDAGRYTPKPSYAAYATLIRQIAGQSFSGGGDIGNSVYDERFGAVHVLWSTSDHQTITIASSAPLVVTTMTGKVQTYIPSAGKVILSLSEDPLYVSAVGSLAISAR
jgi:Glycosyl hydrolase catalytic core